MEYDRMMRLAAARSRLEFLQSAYVSFQQHAQQSAESAAVAMSTNPTHAGVHGAPYQPHGVRQGHDAQAGMHVDAEEVVQPITDAVGVDIPSGPHTAIPVAHLAAPSPAAPAAAGAPSPAFISSIYRHSLVTT